MSRLIKDDFSKVLKYLSSYSLNAYKDAKKFQSSLSELHKRVYSFLIFVIELNKEKDKSISDLQYSYFLESYSNVQQAFFLAIHGCYKGVKLLLRSSIENFLKGIICGDNKAILTTKSVYEVFDIAKAEELLASHISLYNNIHEVYVELCSDVHTADISHMSHSVALTDYPAFNEYEFSVIKRQFSTLIIAYVTLLA